MRQTGNANDSRRQRPLPRAGVSRTQAISRSGGEFASGRNLIHRPTWLRRGRRVPVIRELVTGLSVVVSGSTVPPLPPRPAPGPNRCRWRRSVDELGPRSHSLSRPRRHSLAGQGGRSVSSQAQFGLGGQSVEHFKEPGRGAATSCRESWRHWPRAWSSRFEPADSSAPLNCFASWRCSAPRDKSRRSWKCFSGNWNLSDEQAAGLAAALIEIPPLGSAAKRTPRRRRCVRPGAALRDFALRRIARSRSATATPWRKSSSRQACRISLLRIQGRRAGSGGHGGVDQRIPTQRRQSRPKAGLLRRHRVADPVRVCNGLARQHRHDNSDRARVRSSDWPSSTTPWPPRRAHGSPSCSTPIPDRRVPPSAISSQPQSRDSFH